LRVTGGSLRGRNIQAPSNLPIRPTTDFAKEALFNILNNRYDFTTLSVIDLFAGAGSISYEFASRGARSIISVDQDSRCIRFIKKIAEEWKLDCIHPIVSDVFKYLKRSTQQADIIFADPPFELKQTEELPDLILDKNLLNPGGCLIVEHQSKRVLESKHQPFEVRKYGNCAFSFYKVDEPGVV